VKGYLLLVLEDDARDRVWVVAEAARVRRRCAGSGFIPFRLEDEAVVGGWCLRVGAGGLTSLLFLRSMRKGTAVLKGARDPHNVVPAQLRLELGHVDVGLGRGTRECILGVIIHHEKVVLGTGVEAGRVVHAVLVVVGGVAAVGCWSEEPFFLGQ
jgi:hypothetical protein